MAQSYFDLVSNIYKRSDKDQDGFIWLVKIKGTLSRTFFGFFSKTAPKLRLSTFNHAGNAPRT